MRIFSGIQPSGVIHIGNYLGAIRQWTTLQQEHECLFCIADLHAITVPYDKDSMQERIRETAISYLASGIDSDRSTIFVQSHVPEHTELCWLLNSVTPIGDLERMTQYKDKAKKIASHKHLVSAGLLNYPILMASDILLYKTERVPIGEDQVQHLEFTRTIAENFNARFGTIFPLPQALQEKHVSRVKSLADPQRKMSKSDSPDHYISLFETPDEIRRKIMKAVTDSDGSVRYEKENKPGISNLLEIYAAFQNTSVQEAEKEFSSATYASFKEAVAESLISHLGTFREKRDYFLSHPDEVQDILDRGAQRAREHASRTMHEAKRAMGLLS